MKDTTTKNIFGQAAEIIIILIVSGFMFTESMNFFYYAFPPDQQNIAWLGLGLTGGGMIAYFVMLKTGQANTPLKRVIILTMIAVCTLGELATAGYGASVEMLKNSGMSMTTEGVQTFVLVIRILGLFHALALIGFLGGDDIAAALEDKNHDGVPDIFQRKTTNVMAQVVKQEQQDEDFTDPPSRQS